VPPPLVLPLLSPLSLVGPAAPFPAPAPFAVLAAIIRVSVVSPPTRFALAMLTPVPVPIAVFAAIPAVPAAVGVCLPVRGPALPVAVVPVSVSVAPGVCLPVSVSVAAGTRTCLPAITFIPTAGAAVLVPIAVSALPVTLPPPIIVASLPVQRRTSGRKRSKILPKDLRRRVRQLPVSLRSWAKLG